jgi:uncharacterized membrane protein YdfJ with MMPL/SSD domain
VIDTGHGIFTAAFTTAMPFLALVISDVRALSELGLLVGLGVLFSMYATFFFLPPLLLFAEQRYPTLSTARSAVRAQPALGVAMSRPVALCRYLRSFSCLVPPSVPPSGG